MPLGVCLASAGNFPKTGFQDSGIIGPCTCITYSRTKENLPSGGGVSAGSKPQGGSMRLNDLKAVVLRTALAGALCCGLSQSGFGQVPNFANLQSQLQQNQQGSTASQV